MAAIEPKTVTLKNGQEACIRTPVAEDTEKVLEYLKAIFVDDWFFLTTAEEAKEWQTPQREQERIETYYQDENKLLVVSVVDDKVVSMSHIECGFKKRLQHVAFMGISILDGYRGNGLGRAIMQTMIDWGRRHRLVEKLILEVWAKNERAIALYDKMGFVEEGRKVRQLKYANGTYDDMVCMYRFVE